MPMTDLSRLEPNWNIPRFRLVTRRRLVEFAWHEHFHRHPDPFVWDSDLCPSVGHRRRASCIRRSGGIRSHPLVQQ